MALRRASFFSKSTKEAEAIPLPACDAFNTIQAAVDEAKKGKRRPSKSTEKTTATPTTEADSDSDEEYVRG